MEPAKDRDQQELDALLGIATKSLEVAHLRLLSTASPEVESANAMIWFDEDFKKLRAELDVALNSLQSRVIFLRNEAVHARDKANGFYPMGPK